MKCPKCDHPVQPRLMELVIVYLAVVIPFWAMASDWSDLDEVFKSGIGAGFLSTIVLVYKLWKGRSSGNSDD